MKGDLFVDESNVFAYTAVNAIKETLGVYNPLVLYGPTECGKTHLVQELGKTFLQKGLKVAMLDGNTLLETLVDKLKKKENINDWFCDVDVVIIENLQELVGRETSQCEVGRMICRSAEQQGKQIVCTSTLSTAHTDLKPLSTYLRKCNKMVELDIALPREKIKKQFLEQILKRENITIGVDEQELVIAKASTCNTIESVIKQAKLHCKLMKCEMNRDILLQVFAERTK